MVFRNVSELPQSVRDALPSAAGKAMFRAVVNSQLTAGKKESVAFATAWTALQRAGYKKEGDVWIKKSETYDAPEAARNNARRALKWREEHGDEVKGGTQVGWTRASQLASGEKLSRSTVNRMAMFNRHRSNSEVAPEYRDEPWKDAGHVAWLLWGGTSGVDWARGITGSLSKREDSEEEDDVESEDEVDDEKEDDYENEDLLDAAIRAILQTVMEKEASYTSDVTIVKMDDDQRIVWGWASVATENGDPVFDVHGDHIPMSELTKASVEFMEDVRIGKTLHQGQKVSSVIGCLPLSAELAKALGIESNREGLIMGFRVHDDETWKLIKSGELPALSIGGRGRRYDV